MGTYSTYPITFSDGVTSDVGAYLPSSYTDGENQKWVIVCHGKGSSHQSFTTNASWRLMADTYGIVIVGVTDPSTWPWLMSYGKTADYLLEMIEFIKPKLNLYDYLPCLAGFSMGGYKTMYEMTHRASNYSAFACSAAPADMIQWGSIEGWVPTSYFGGTYPNTDPTANDCWEDNSPTRLFPTAELSGRKAWIAHGVDDPTVPLTTIFNPLRDAIPAANLFKAYAVTGGVHEEMIRRTEYRDEAFAFFSTESKLVNPPKVLSTFPEPIIFGETVIGEVKEISNTTDVEATTAYTTAEAYTPSLKMNSLIPPTAFANAGAYVSSTAMTSITPLTAYATAEANPISISIQLATAYSEAEAYTPSVVMLRLVPKTAYTTANAYMPTLTFRKPKPKYIFKGLPRKFLFKGA